MIFSFHFIFQMSLELLRYNASFAVIK